jgi:inner membrane protein
VHPFEDLLGPAVWMAVSGLFSYLAPFSSSLQLAWQGQWGLSAWPNVRIAIVLLLVTLWLAWRRGFSPLEMVSAGADSSLVTALRRRGPARTAV